MEKPMKCTKLVEDLKRQIMSGEIKPGDKISSENVLAREYDISRQTVRKAIDILRNEGFLYAEHGRGTFCSDMIKQEGNSGNIAVVMTYLSDYIFPHIIRGIDEVLEKEEYSILLKSTHNYRKVEAKCLEELVKKNIDGLIIEPSKSQIAFKNHDIFAMLERYKVPFVFVQGVYHGMEDKPYVLLDDEKGGYMITKYLIEQGHQRIAGVFKADDRQGQNRHKGYVKALQEAGIWYDPSLVVWYHTEDMNTLPYEMMQEIALREKIDAVVTYNDRIAIDVIRALEEKGFSVPEDISVTGFDDSEFARNFKVPLTTIKHPQSKIGEAAAELLIKLVKGHAVEEDKLHVMMEPVLVVRESTRKK